MATKARDRVKETTTTTGTGNITLGGAVLGFRTVISALNVGDSHDFCIDSGGAEWEVSRCTVVSSTVISRDTVKASSNSGSLVNFSAGTKNVFLMPSAINGLTNESLEVMAANTVKANATGSSATPQDVTKASFITWLGLVVGDISGAAATASISAVGFSGAYADLSGKPVLVAVSTSGSASDLTAGTLPAARLPTPTSTSLGGVRSLAASTGSAIGSIGTDGIPVMTAVGYRNIPVTDKSADYTTTTADVGSCLRHPSTDANARTFTLDGTVHTAGDAITFMNRTSQVLSITISSGTLTLAGSTTTGTRSLAQNGLATVLFDAAGVGIISGAGLT